jgi:hypothetical protein
MSKARGKPKPKPATPPVVPWANDLVHVQRSINSLAARVDQVIKVAETEVNKSIKAYGEDMNAFVNKNIGVMQKEMIDLRARVAALEKTSRDVFESMVRGAVAALRDDKKFHEVMASIARPDELKAIIDRELGRIPQWADDSLKSYLEYEVGPRLAKQIDAALGGFSLRNYLDSTIPVLVERIIRERTCQGVNVAEAIEGRVAGVIPEGAK